MSKEKINRIKNMIDDMEFYGHLYHEDAQAFGWLIKQAERVQELEGKIVAFEVWYMLSEQQNKRYREVIQEVKKSLITARKSYSNNKVNQQVYESLKTIQELEESE